MGRKLKCPHCGGTEFVEDAEASIVKRNFQVPCDESQDIQYGYEYFLGHGKTLGYYCLSCGLAFNAYNEEEFRKELQKLNQLFSGPMWVIYEEAIVHGSCTEVDGLNNVVVESDDGDSFRVAQENIYRTKKAAEKALKIRLEQSVNELREAIDEETEKLKSLTKKLNKIQKEK